MKKLQLIYFIRLFILFPYHAVWGKYLPAREALTLDVPCGKMDTAAKLTQIAYVQSRLFFQLGDEIMIDIERTGYTDDDDYWERAGAFTGKNNKKSGHNQGYGKKEFRSTLPLRYDQIDEDYGKLQPWEFDIKKPIYIPKISKFDKDINRDIKLLGGKWNNTLGWYFQEKQQYIPVIKIKLIDLYNEDGYLKTKEQLFSDVGVIDGKKAEEQAKFGRGLSKLNAIDKSVIVPPIPRSSTAQIPGKFIPIPKSTQKPVILPTTPVKSKKQRKREAAEAREKQERLRRAREANKNRANQLAVPQEPVSYPQEPPKAPYHNPNPTHHSFFDDETE